MNVEIRQSASRGRGVFAIKTFAANERIRPLNIEREVTAEHPLATGDDPDHAFFTDGKRLLVGEPDRYLNHCCDPNAYVWYRDEAIDLIARRAIHPGEEITLDYLINNSGGEVWECRCGAKRCRGQTDPSFFALPVEIQVEYFPLLAPWFRRQHAERLTELAKMIGAAGNRPD